ncbi:steroidogenic acute regulatory protein, mitochondrial [Hypomesus transpacificus]|uniref:steroidogenic acute regulatory protein, mitochondrial n=1 Tax=Hypomesus transpacificus TaxID=137520 RepID=UPI001F081424|nr:steroidogenic acute regulatory protein, mitochondrial [Hypomesus transpacificus]
MLPAVVKLCCGISYPHLRSMAGLQRTAMAAIGQEIAHLQRGGRVQLPEWMGHIGWRDESRREEVRLVNTGDLLYIHQGQEALSKALEIAEDKDGWKIEITEENGDVICSKVLPGAKKVFRLEAVLNATPEELHTILFVKVEEMQQWNPSIQHIKILKQVNAETMVTHEVSAATASNLIGQRDFLSVRHCYKQNSRIYLGGMATDIESHPPQKNFVRAQDGPTCIIIEALGDDTRKSRFIWLLNMDVKGWLPKAIVNQALPRAQVDFTRHLRRRLTEGPVHG